MKTEKHVAVARRRELHDSLDQILSRPDLERVIPQLQPDVLHQVITRVGLEDAVEIVALATPEQLQHVFDLDLWRAAAPGLDEHLDAARFGQWIDVMFQAGPDVAAAKLAQMPFDLTVSALAQHIRVQDKATLSYNNLDGSELHRELGDGLNCELAGCVIEARSDDAWDQIIAVLASLETHHRDAFRAIMHGVISLSHGGFEVDRLRTILGSREQDLFDLAIERERRRESQGYVTPAQARAFLQSARQGAHTASGSLMRAHFQATRDGAGPGLMKRAEEPSREAEQFAYLSNLLVAGCPVNGRAFTPREAAEAVGAICTLGHERGSSTDLAGAFEAGWRMLYTDVAMAAAEQLILLASDLRVRDPFVQDGLDTLRTDMIKQWRAGTPWLAAESLDVIMILDKPSWATLIGLIAECPIILEGALDPQAHRIDTNAFGFFTSMEQIASARAFVSGLSAGGSLLF